MKGYIFSWRNHQGGVLSVVWLGLVVRLSQLSPCEGSFPMSIAIAFDTYVFVKKLKDAGMSEEQARILAETHKRTD